MRAVFYEEGCLTRRRGTNLARWVVLLAEGALRKNAARTRVNDLQIYMGTRAALLSCLLLLAGSMDGVLEVIHG